MPGFRLRKKGVELLDFSLVTGFRLRKMGAEFLDLRLVPSFRSRKMGIELLDLNLVASFCLREKFAVEMFDLRDPCWNEGIQPADGSGKQIGLLGFRSVAARRLCHLRFLSSSPCPLAT